MTRRRSTGARCRLTFTIVAWPILTAYREGSNTGHVALLGLMTPFDKPLGIEGSIYDWGYTYLDGFAAVTVNSKNVTLDELKPGITVTLQVAADGKTVLRVIATDRRKVEQ